MTKPNPITLDAIARQSGGLAMVAMDQRESLRAMFAAAGAGRPDDAVLTRFKRDVAEILGPLASGFLIDRHYGFDSIRDEHVLAAPTGLILAADALTQDDGGPVEETALDETVAADGFDLHGVVALKLLVIWRRDAQRAQRVALTKSFIELARRRGVLSVLEPVVRATARELDDGSWEQGEAIREAARELSPLGASLYKAQVPLSGRGTPEEQYDASVALNGAITGPWVVLSQGVDRHSFLPAVQAACRAGASGFLAGRALWSDIVGSADVRGDLSSIAAARLQRLSEIVDREARPWSHA